MYYFSFIGTVNPLSLIPQGSPISALFANVYAIDFDKKMNSYVK